MSTPTATPHTPTLTAIRLNNRKSEETPCFTAKLHFEGAAYAVKNGGHGGGNDYFPQLSSAVHAALNKWAASTFPPITECGGCKLRKPLPMDFETWTFERAFSCAS